MSLAFISMPGGPEWLVIGFIGLMLFGKRLPEVAQSLGKSVTEFKKGLQGIGSEEPRVSLPTTNTTTTLEVASHEQSAEQTGTTGPIQVE